MGRKRRFGWTHTEYASMLDDAGGPVMAVIFIAICVIAFHIVGELIKWASH